MDVELVENGGYENETNNDVSDNDVIAPTNDNQIETEESDVEIQIRRRHLRNFDIFANDHESPCSAWSAREHENIKKKCERG